MLLVFFCLKIAAASTAPTLVANGEACNSIEEARARVQQNLRGLEIEPDARGIRVGVVPNVNAVGATVKGTVVNARHEEAWTLNYAPDCTLLSVIKSSGLAYGDVVPLDQGADGRAGHALRVAWPALEKLTPSDGATAGVVTQHGQVLRVWRIELETMTTLAKADVASNGEVVLVRAVNESWTPPPSAVASFLASAITAWVGDK